MCGKEEDAIQQEQMWCAASQNGLDSGVPLLPTVQGSLKASVITVSIVVGSVENITCFAPAGK